MELISNSLRVAQDAMVKPDGAAQPAAGDDEDTAMDGAESSSQRHATGR